MKPWAILISTLLVGLAIGVGGTILLPSAIAPYLVPALRAPRRWVEGQVIGKQGAGPRPREGANGRSTHPGDIYEKGAGDRPSSRAGRLDQLSVGEYRPVRGRSGH